MTDNIVLIGFMGVGKGRTARALAARTGQFAVDCDDLIESFTNTKVKKIFSKFGDFNLWNPINIKLINQLSYWI